MTLPNIFTAEVSQKVIDRINQLDEQTQPLWGKMTVAQMLAHCNVSYEMVYEDKHPRPKFPMTLILKAFIRRTVTGPAPYKRNTPTAPAFRMTTDKNFQAEKSRLVAHIRKTQELGEQYFDGKLSHSFGPLRIDEWNNMFYKHLDHHLTQFGKT